MKKNYSTPIIRLIDLEEEDGLLSVSQGEGEGEGEAKGDGEDGHIVTESTRENRIWNRSSQKSGLWK